MFTFVVNGLEMTLMKMRLIAVCRNLILLRPKRSFCTECCIRKCPYSSDSNSNRLKVPPEPTWSPIDESALPPVTAVDITLINHLERLSLVEFGNKQGIERLETAVRFADSLLRVDTSNVEPMTSVLEDRALYLRRDEVTDGKCRYNLLSIAAKTVEEYYVAPPGNIPLSKDRQYSDTNSDEQPAT